MDLNNLQGSGIRGLTPTLLWLAKIWVWLLFLYKESWWWFFHFSIALYRWYADWCKKYGWGQQVENFVE
jgi:hypothetical protein